MYKKLGKIIILLIISLFSITGCRYQFPAEMKLAVLCTSAAAPQSELIFLNEDGIPLHSMHFKAQGMFTIEQPTPDQLALPVMYADQIIFIDLAKTAIETRKTRPYPIFYKSLGDTEFVVYNSDVKGDIDYLTYVLKTGSGEKTLRIKGFPLALTVAEMKAYIYLDKKGEPDEILVMDLQDFQATELPLLQDLEGVGDLAYIDGNLLIPHSSTNELVIIPVYGYESARTQITSVQLPYDTPHLIFEYGERLVVAHYNGGISMLNKTSYQVEKSTQLPYTVLKAQIMDGKMYLLVKDGQSERKIVVVDMANLNVLKTIAVKCDQGLLVQNFLVLQ